MKSRYPGGRTVEQKNAARDMTLAERQAHHEQKKDAYKRNGSVKPRSVKHCPPRG